MADPNSWTLVFFSSSLTEPNASYIAYLPTGEIDFSQTPLSDIAAINKTLAPSITIANSLAVNAGVMDFDFYRFINWIFVVHYWALLLEFGQVAPTTFNYNSTLNQLIFNENTPYSSANNIFVNTTLFQIYSDYLRDTILPLLGSSFQSLPAFMPLTPENQMNASVVTLNVLYSCTDLALKSGIELVISLLVADWAFVNAFLAIALIAGKWLETRRTQDGKIRTTFI